MRDIHLHLSGATSPVLLYEIINETGLKIKTKTYNDFFENITMDKDKVKSLDDYLEIIHVIDDAQSSPRAIEMSFYNSYRDCFLSGCDYLELRWNPYKRSQNFKIDFDRLIMSARAGIEKAQSIFQIKGNMLFCLGRDISDAANEALFKKAVQYFGKGVIGIDVAGPEAKCPLKQDFPHYYKTANALGMVTTIHVGEPLYDGVEDALADVLENYKPQRIGHGVQIHRFPELMKKASSMGIVFEICISSNLMSKSIASEEDFIPVFKAFEEYGIKYEICTDATFSLHTNISLEHEKYNKIMEIAKKKIKPTKKEE